MAKMKKASLVEVWEDTVDVWDLLKSLLLCTGICMAGYVLTPLDPPYPLVVGLIGALIGFVLSTLLIKPKRVFVKWKGEPVSANETGSETGSKETGRRDEQ